jgi:hypothetical protein
VSKVVARMSMSLDGYVADRNDGVVLCSPVDTFDVAQGWAWQPDGDSGRRRYTPALPSRQGVVLPHTVLARR